MLSLEPVLLCHQYEQVCNTDHNNHTTRNNRLDITQWFEVVRLPLGRFMYGAAENAVFIGKAYG
jgi:hypothetical protein